MANPPDPINHIVLTIPPHQAKPVLRALLYAILFQRELENVEPETYEILDAHVACAPSAATEKEVSGRLDEFAREYLETGADKGEIAVVFLQRQPRRGWFAITEELIPWEAHYITLHFSPSSSSAPRKNPLPGALLDLLRFCSERRGNVPPLVGGADPGQLSHQILIAPPPPSDLLAPSSPPLSAPPRLTSPPPVPSLTTTPATAISKDLHPPSTSSAAAMGGIGGIGYLEQARDGLRMVGQKAGGIAGQWSGRGRGG